MADKLKQGISVVPTFVDGEQPPANKFNSLGAQLRHATDALERAIGDIHNQSWPYTSSSTTPLSMAWGRSRTSTSALTSATERYLDIANIARLIGPASNLNPRMLESNSVTESVPSGSTLHEFSLKYPVDGTLSSANPTFSDTTVFATFVSSASSVNATGEYSVTQDGKVYCWTAANGGTVTYTVDPSSFAGGQSPQAARFNVIPDPNQIAAGSGLTVSGPDSSGRYTVTLPTVTHQQSNYSGSSIALTSEDANYSVQLRLPKVLTDNFSSGMQIPDGFLFLKNEDTNEVYESATYTYISDTSFYVSGVTLTTTETFSCMTVGSDITTAIDDLRIKSHHSHDRSFGEPFVPLSAISGIFATAGAGGPWMPSSMASNWAPMYLHRDGYTSGENDMKGILRMLSGIAIELGSSWRTIADDGTDLIIKNTGASGDLVLTASGATANIRTTDAVLLDTGIQGSAAGTSLGDAPVKPYYFTPANIDMTVGSTALVFDDDLSAYTVVSYTIMISDGTNWHTGSSMDVTDLTGQWEFQHEFRPTGNGQIYVLSGSNAGASWVGKTSQAVRILVWYTD